jgi:hypothetical protein
MRALAMVHRYLSVAWLIWRCNITQMRSKPRRNARAHAGAKIVGLISDTHSLLRDEALARISHQD